MNKLGSLEQLRKEIECKREKLNNLIITETDKNKLLILSIELDDVINQYYNWMEG